MTNDKFPSKQNLLLRGARFDVIGIDLPRRDGTTVRREFIRHPGAVVLLPLLDDDHVVLIQNERPAIGATLLELPAGTCEPPEPPLTTAGRELAEETGYAAGRLDVLSEFYSAPGLGDELMTLVLARDFSQVGQSLDEVERITPVVKTRGEVAELLASGKIRDAKTLIGLMHYLYVLPLNCP